MHHNIKFQMAECFQASERLFESVQQKTAALKSFQQGLAVEESKPQPQFLQHFQRAIEEG